MPQKSPNYGIVYVLTNPAMPGLVKIGMTNKESVDARLNELLGIEHALQPTSYRTYNGKNLMDIYNETYVIGEE
jgi:hypothetical protein